MVDEQKSILYKEVFLSVKGKEVLQSMAEDSGYLSGTFSKDTNECYFRLGKQSVIREILDIIDADLDDIRAMRKKEIKRYVDPRFNHQVPNNH